MKRKCYCGHLTGAGLPVGDNWTIYGLKCEVGWRVRIGMESVETKRPQKLSPRQEGWEQERSRRKWGVCTRWGPVWRALSAMPFGWEASFVQLETASVGEGMWVKPRQELTEQGINIKPRFSIAGSWMLMNATFLIWGGKKNLTLIPVRIRHWPSTSFCKKLILETIASILLKGSSVVCGMSNTSLLPAKPCETTSSEI